MESNDLSEKRRQLNENRKNRAQFLEHCDSFSQNFEEKGRIDDKRDVQSKFSVNVHSSDLSRTKAITDDLEASRMNISTIVESQPNLTVVSKEDHSQALKSVEPIAEKALITQPASNSAIRENSDSSDHQEESPFETFSVPNRIGSKNVGKPQPKLLNMENNDELSDEEGAGDINKPNISHFLTREERKVLSPEQRAAWRALQQDLTSKRKDFHGAVTFAFDGIFSWEMYGSAEAVDEMGKEYTEYLMRCQWGSTWDNLQPWIAARRYREFDRLDHELRRRYPEFANQMPRLPEKDYFRFLESDVISKRRRNIQEYFSVLVSTMPTILRGSVIDEFLGINERIVCIKKQLTENSDNSLFLRSDDVVDKMNDTTSSDASIMSSRLGDSEIIISTPDLAENYKQKYNSKPMDEDNLGKLEEEIRELLFCLSNHSAQDILRGSKVIKLLIACTSKWPSLRATCEFGSADFTLIPRSLQAEEDLQRCLEQFRSLSVVHQLG